MFFVPRARCNFTKAPWRFDLLSQRIGKACAAFRVVDPPPFPYSVFGPPGAPASISHTVDDHNGPRRKSFLDGYRQDWYLMEA
jgi:hypothetical protein